MAPRDPCPACGGSGNEKVVSNPDWPNGSKPYYEATGEDCPTCGGSGERSKRDEQFWDDFTEALARFIYGEKRYRKLPLDAARDDARNYVYNARKLVERAAS